MDSLAGLHRANIPRMSHLTLAEKFLKDSGRSDGRKPEAQFKDLRKSVERIIAHLKQERAKKDN